MRLIVKGPEPAALTLWKSDFPGGTYDQLTDTRGIAVRKSIRTACISEQKYICAYCCDRIDNSNSHNEHIQPQGAAPHATLDYENIVASCQSNRHCGHKKDSNIIQLTPLMPSCETEVKYYLSGKMSHSTPRGQQFHTVLGLRESSLTSRRKQLIDTLIFSIGTNEDEIELMDDELLEMLIEDLKKTDAAGRLEAFAPVLSCILTEYLS